jgi:hypothetical protein
MKKSLSSFALPAIAALALAAGAVAPAAAGVVPAVNAVSQAAATGESTVVKADWDKRRHWRHHRRHHRHWRHHRPRSGIYFHFGSPRYVAPRYVYPGRGLPPAHIRWCYNHYRSYRASDNTFQPYHGPRRQCRSPYW